MKKYIAVILIIGIGLASVLFYNTKQVNEKAYKSFSDSGYVLQSKEENQNEIERYYFGSEQKYKQNYNEKITFEDTNGEKVTSDLNNYIHYSNGSISAFKNGVLVDLTMIDTDPIFYYNVAANSTLTKYGDSYKIKNLDKELTFKYLLWKIDSNKYLAAGKGLRITFEDGSEKIIDGFLEIEYCDNEVVKIYNQELMYQTISEETILHVPDDIKINLVTKIVSKGDENHMSLESMAIDSEDNIPIVDLEDEEEETEEDTNTTNEQTTVNQNNNNSQNTVQNSQIQNNQQNSSTLLNGSGESVVDDNPTVIKTPKYKMTSFTAGATEIKATIEITDEDGLLKQDSVVKIIKAETSKVVCSQTYKLGEYQITFDTSSLGATATHTENIMPDTEYIMQVESAYEVDGISYQKNFIYKRFKTSIVGVTFEKDVFTDESLSFNLKFEKNSGISKVDMKIYGPDGKEIETQSQEIYNDNVAEGTETLVNFYQLDSNTQYEIKLTNVTFGASVVQGTGFDVSKYYTTLKANPELEAPKHQIDKRDGKITLTAPVLKDEDDAIIGYRFELYEIFTEEEIEEPTDEPEGEEPLPVGEGVPEDGGNQDSEPEEGGAQGGPEGGEEEKPEEEQPAGPVEILVKTIESEENEVEFDIDRNIFRSGFSYKYKVIAIYDDNEKIRETAKISTTPVSINFDRFPTVRFVEDQIKHDKIVGKLVITDEDKVVGLGGDDEFLITYQDSLGRGGSFNSYGSLEIPININNLKSNETYQFSIYGTVNLNDGNGDRKQTFIGGAFVTTAEPEPMQATYVVNENEEHKAERFAVNFQLRSVNTYNTGYEASTMEKLTLEIYSGITVPGEEPTGEFIGRCIMVDEYDQDPYTSSIDDECYKGIKVLTPESFNAENADFPEANYTIKVLPAIDYTDYENELPIVNNTFNVATVGTIPKPPDEFFDEAELVYFKDYKKVFGKEWEGEYELSPYTPVGVRLKAKELPDNQQRYAKTITYMAVNPTTHEIIQEIPGTINGETNNFEELLIELNSGTTNDVVDTTLTRGNIYYFTYVVELDLNPDPEVEEIGVYPDEIYDIDGITFANKSKNFTIAKEEIQIVMYPTTSNGVSRTYKYQILDVDNTLINNEFNVTIDDVLLTDENGELPTFVVDNSKYGSDNWENITFGNLTDGQLKITIARKKVKSYVQEENLEKVLVDEYYEYWNDISDLRYKINSGSGETQFNHVVIQLMDSSGKTYGVESLNKVAAFDVTVSALDGSVVTKTFKYKTLNDTNQILIPFTDMAEFTGKKIEINLIAWYDSGFAGYEVALNGTNPVAFQNAYTNAKDKVYYTLEQNLSTGEWYLSPRERLMGLLFTLIDNEKPNNLGIVNLLDNTQNNIELDVSDEGKGFMVPKEDDVSLLPKLIEKLNIECEGENTMTFKSILPGISLKSDKITEELEAFQIEPTIIVPEGTVIEKDPTSGDALIYIELYQTNASGGARVYQGVAVKTLDELIHGKVRFTNDDFTLDTGKAGLKQKSHYALRFYTYVEGETGKKYLYDIDSLTTGKYYNFSTLSDIDITDINVAYVAAGYWNKVMRLTYKVGTITGYQEIRYEIYTKKADGTYNTDTPFLKFKTTTLKQSMVEEISANPGGIWTFPASYKVKITPVVILDDGDEIFLESAEKEFSTPELTDPVIRAKAIRISSDGSNDIQLTVDIVDTYKILVDSRYKLKVYKEVNGIDQDVTEDLGLTDSVYDATIPQVIRIRNTDVNDKYTIQIVAQVDRKNRNYNYEDFSKILTVEPINEYGINVGNITLSKNPDNSNKIDVTFSESDKLLQISKIKYSIYNYASFAPGQVIETFAPTTYNVGADSYYKMTLSQQIDGTPGSYFIEFQFIYFDPDLQQDVVVVARTEEYIYSN